MFGFLAVLLVVALLAFVVMPTAPLAVDDGAVAASGVTTAAGVALPEGSSLIVPAVELSEPVSALQAPTTYMLIALGASLVITAVACRRRLKSTIELIMRRISDSTTLEGTMAGRGPRDCILPTAA